MGGSPLKRVMRSLGLAGKEEGRAGRKNKPALEIEPGRSGRSPFLALRGELDHHTAQDLLEAMEQALAEEEESHSLVLGLDELTYIDSGGLALLFDVAKALEREGRGGWLGILNPSPNVRRLLEISGLGSVEHVKVLTDEAGDENFRSSESEVT